MSILHRRDMHTRYSRQDSTRWCSGCRPESRTWWNWGIDSFEMRWPWWAWVTLKSSSWQRGHLAVAGCGNDAICWSSQLTDVVDDLQGEV